MRKSIFICVALILATPAFALNDTIGVTPGSGKTANLISFASTRVISEVGLCDATTENQCATIKAGNTGGTTDIAVAVYDANLLAAVQAAVPGLNATAFNTNSYLTGATNALNADLNGNLFVNLSGAGQGAFGATTPTRGLTQGCNSVNAFPAEVSNGQLSPPLCGLSGTTIVRFFAPKEVLQRGTATTTGNTATTVLAASGSASLKEYITDWECWNNSATGDLITFNDTETTGSGTQILLPAGGGSNKSLLSPLVVAANTAVTFTPSTSQTTIGCNVQGFYGP